jgi:hypothetical protein
VITDMHPSNKMFNWEVEKSSCHDKVLQTNPECTWLVGIAVTNADMRA